MYFVYCPIIIKGGTFIIAYDKIHDTFSFFEYNTRYKSLFLQLLRTEEYITSKTLSEILNVSIRTIKNDIKLIREELPENIYIISKPAKGYLLKIEEDNLEKKLKDYFQIYQPKTINTEFDERVIFILRYFMSKNEYIRMEELQYQLNTNTSNSLSKELKAVRKKLCNYNLRLKINTQRGMLIEGSEFNKMMLTVQLFKLFFEGNYLISEISQFNELFKITSEEKNKIRKIVIDALSNSRIVFSDVYVERFIIILIYLKNLEQSKQDLLDININNFDYKITDEYSVILEISSKLQQKLDQIRLKNNVIKCLTYIAIMSTDLYRYKDCSEKNYGILTQYAKKLRKEILDYFSQVFFIDLSIDKVLYKDLLKVLIPISIKILINISDDINLGYFDWEITKSNQLIYFYINKLKFNVKYFQNYTLSIREVQLLSDILSGYINRINIPSKKLKLAIIAIDSRLLTQHLKSILKEYFRESIESIDTKTLYELDNEKNNDYDFYLTTSYGKHLNIEYEPIYFTDSNVSESDYVDSLRHIFYDANNYDQILPKITYKKIKDVDQIELIYLEKTKNKSIDDTLLLDEDLNMKILLNLNSNHEDFIIYYFDNYKTKKFQQYLVIINVNINGNTLKFKMISEVISSLSKNIEQIIKLKTTSYRYILDGNIMPK